MNRARRLLWPSLRIALAFWISATVPLGAQVATRFEPSPCPFEGGAWLERENIDCGTLVVPESRDRPDSRTLRLAVAILRSTADEPRADPVVWLSGGPGGAAVRFARSFSASPLTRAIRRERDFIVWDQRGTGYSDPAFCPDQSARLLSVENGGNDDPLRTALEIVSACRDRMVAEGLDFSQYNSVTSAHDLDALRGALGYERWNVFGGSYGARLALVAAREVPEGIRALILDATPPPNVGGGDNTTANVARSLDLVFRQCESSPACHAQFPDLESEFYAAIDELNADPLTLPMADTSRFPSGRIVLDGRTFALGIFRALYSRYFIPLVPYAIRQMRERNVPLLVGLADALAPDPLALNPWLEYAVECYESLPLLSAERPAGAGDRRLAMIADTLLRPICGAWHSERGDTARLRDPVTTDLPTLISVGEFDPVTPPYYSRLVTEHLPNSHYLEVRGMGHGSLPFTACTREIVVSFLDTPATVPDTACLAELPGVAFVVDLHIEPAIGSVARELAAGPGLGLKLWLGATLLLLVSAMLGWPAVALVRRIRRRPAPPPRDARRLARPLAWLAALAALGLVVGLASVVRRVAAQNPYVIGFGIPQSAAPILWLPRVVVPATLGVVAFAVLAWRRGWWGRAGRLHYSLVAAACVAFTAFLVTRGLL